MNQAISRAYRINLLKVYALVYTLVASPMIFYGLNYIEMVKDHLGPFLALTLAVMATSVAVCFLVERISNKRIHAFLEQRDLGGYPLPSLKRSAYHFPLYVLSVMLFGWIILENLFVLLPLYLVYSGRFSDFLISVLLSTSGGLMSTPMTYFISERTSSLFLSLPEVKALPEPDRVVRIPMTAKVTMVCLFIIVTLIMNTTGPVLLNLTYRLTEAETIVNFLVVGVQGLLSTIVISLLFARSIKKPVANLRECADIVKGGDLSPVTPRLTNDELGDASDSFNVFLESLSTIVSDVQDSVRDTRRNVDDLQAAMTRTDHSVDEINRSAGEVQRTIVSQSSVIDGVTKTLQDISSTIESQNAKVQRQSASVSEGSTAIEELIANVRSIGANLNASAAEFETLQNAIRLGSGTVGRLNETVVFLNRQSDSVIEANQIIRSIASQTNLLAMNAAIEAAHAGDAGRGFAVVADEIRKLAEVSNQQSKLISDNLKGLKQSIDQAVAIAGETGVSFERIILSVDAVNGLEREIKDSVEEQASGSAQILQALNGINRMTAEVDAGSRKMLEGSGGIMKEVVGLGEITATIRNSALLVVEKARDVKENARQSMDLLDLSAASTRKIDNLTERFKIRAKKA